MNAEEIYRLIDTQAPFSQSESWDNTGLLLGNKNVESDIVVTVLDVTDAALRFAMSVGAKIIVSHHPVIFHPLSCLISDSIVSKTVKAGITVISAHTNIDCCEDLCNDNYIVSALGLQTPVRLSCDGYGFYGTISPLTVCEIAEKLKATLCAPCVRVYGDSKKTVKSVSVCCGAGGDFIDDAMVASEVYLTSDLKHSDILYAVGHSLPVIDAGHFFMERIFAANMAKFLCSHGIYAVQFDEIPFETTIL